MCKLWRRRANLKVRSNKRQEDTGSLLESKGKDREQTIVFKIEQTTELQLHAQLPPRRRSTRWSVDSFWML